MKAKVLLLTILCGVVLTLSAQEYQPQIGFSTENGSKTNFKKNKASDNIFISIAGGGNVLLGDLNGNAAFGDRIAPHGAISLGKWYNPYLAFRLQVNAGLMNNFSNNGQQEFQWINPHADIMWDITNFWAPYKEKKVFHLIPFVGLGYGVRAGTTVDGISYSRSESLTANGGAQLLFRLSKRVDLFLEGQYVLVGDHWNRTSTDRHEYDRPFEAMLGLNFNLGRKEFEVLEPMDYALLNDLNSQINALRARNSELEKRPEYCPECPPAAPALAQAKEYINNTVFFRLNSAKIDKNQEGNIFNTAEFAKKKGAAIKLVGYADRKTGNPDYNKGISERRAKAVAKQLIDKYGISSHNISIEWRGDEIQPYEENAWNRVVIMNTNE
ncbi:MAG: OmpA family protein [Tannerella sp.]|jgi:outer membrane protein OmpA-like peptidoglycan-associated protein|nr:OmpA family protein [Tannerella sp.]